MGLEPKPLLPCGAAPLTALPLPAGRRRPAALAAKTQANTFFPLCPQPERSPCQWVGRLQDVSGVQQGARDRDRKAMALGGGAAGMSLRMISQLGLQRILGTSDLELALLASPGRRGALRAGPLGQADWWQWAVLALCPGNWGLLLKAKSQR